MKFATIHPIGWHTQPHCQDTNFWTPLEQFLISKGHEICGVDFADAVLFDSAIWIQADGSITQYYRRTLDHVLAAGLAIVFFDEWDHRDTTNAFGYDLGHWIAGDARKLAAVGADWSNFLLAAMGSQPILFFIRKMHLGRHSYWPNCFPLEYAMLSDFPCDSRDDFMARPHDACFIGCVGEGTQRQKALAGLLEHASDLKLDIRIIDCKDRLSRDDWRAAHRKAKFFIEADNESLSSERPPDLMTIAAMLRIKGDQRLPYPRTDGVDCVEIGDYWGNITAADVAKVLMLCTIDRESAYWIYRNGAEHMRLNYSMDARNQYIYETMAGFLPNFTP